MKLGKIAEICYNITTSYLNLPGNTDIIISTQKAILTTKHQLLDDAFARWSPLNGDISFSYNGGKDCQVLLLIYLSCLWEFFLNTIKGSQYGGNSHQFPLFELPTVFIDQEETFSTIKAFVEDTSDRYGLSLYESSRNDTVKMSMAMAFEHYLSLHQETKAIVIGIRHSDPFGENLKYIQETDSGWPEFMRIQPILHWNLSNIWSFLLYSGEPICGLYGVGYTSLGGLNNTLPNPYLKLSDNTEEKKSEFEWELNHRFENQKLELEIHPNDRAILDTFSNKYKPGWYLTDEKLERAGRLKKTSVKKD
ncbi:hypothetical protein TBLA_0E02660 [Henningerozyma blattae CBS 6284]|uniref:FAD synthase n=1 Tax=Henningerozyma blattae (strain ATCC 34711 / CBS 6284 / DSM 70876 / NBRC 10599 / NRRL Y-10934 / UCD 77-7) TaxID=1071380 RepID=I2H4M0_HENB6|nr:hypothetical protein TBLA_0E02660 [Tetrapisispora blattae CBS 6284]CCH61322.1 hypothetical protein TBLA_0E02660 [Tetrapisispora blattae CBS 6284]